MSVNMSILYLSMQGKRQWSFKLPDSITALELLDYQARGVKAVIVAMRNKEIRIFRDKYLMHTLRVDVSKVYQYVMYIESTHYYGPP